MNIVVRADLRIHGGTLQWEVQRLRVRMKDGERVTEWQSFSWHRRLHDAVRFVGEAELRGAESVKDAITRLDRLERALSLMTARAERIALESLGEQRSRGEGYEGADPLPENP
jgi:hypothetical protein